MITYKRCLATISGLLIWCISCVPDKVEEKPAHHPVNKALSAEVDRKISIFKGEANANIFFSIYEDGKLISNCAPEGEPALAFNDFIDSALRIDCLNGIDDGFGFTMGITKDTSRLRLRLLSARDTLQFAATQNDSAEFGLIVECPRQRLTLANPPEFRKGEVVAGKVELESKPFYQVCRGKAHLVTFRLLVYFKSEPLPVVSRQYKTLNRH